MGLNGLHPCFGVGGDEKIQEGRSEKLTQRRRKKKEYDVPYIIRLWVDESVSGWLNWWRPHLHGYPVSLITIRLGLKLRASWKCYLLQYHQLAAVVLNRPPREKRISATIISRVIKIGCKQGLRICEQDCGYGFTTINIKASHLLFTQKLCTITPENLLLRI